MLDNSDCQVQGSEGNKVKNWVWFIEGLRWSTPLKKVIVFNGNEAGARDKAKNLYGFTRFTKVVKLPIKKGEN